MNEDAVGLTTTSIGTFDKFGRYEFQLGDKADVVVLSEDSRINLFVGGGKGADTLTGGARPDTLYGGRGQDVLTGGGGQDFFGYQRVHDSLARNPDQVTDFHHGDDHFNFFGFDPDANGNRDRLTFIGTAAFSGDVDRYELRVADNGDGRWRIEADANHDKVADFLIMVTTDAPSRAATSCSAEPDRPVARRAPPP